jgi:hypothetical protein
LRLCRSAFFQHRVFGQYPKLNARIQSLATSHSLPDIQVLALRVLQQLRDSGMASKKLKQPVQNYLHKKSPACYGLIFPSHSRYFLFRKEKISGKIEKNVRVGQGMKKNYVDLMERFFIQSILAILDERKMNFSEFAVRVWADAPKKTAVGKFRLMRNATDGKFQNISLVAASRMAEVLGVELSYLLAVAKADAIRALREQEKTENAD